MEDCHQFPLMDMLIELLLICLPTFYKEDIMFRWAFIFAVIALVASLLGFGGVAGLSKDFAYIFLVVAVVLFIIGFISRRT